MTNIFSLDINYLSVLAGAAVCMVIGFLWYSPILFGNLWIKESKIDSNVKKPSNKEMTRTYTASFLGAVIMSWILAALVKMTGTITFAEGAMLGIMVWLGFVATTGVNNVLYERKTVNYYLINVGYYLVNLIIIGGIVAIWK